MLVVTGIAKVRWGRDLDPGCPGNNQGSILAGKQIGCPYIWDPTFRAFAAFKAI